MICEHRLNTPASATSSTRPSPTDYGPPARHACASSNEPANRQKHVFALLRHRSGELAQWATTRRVRTDPRRENPPKTPNQCDGADRSHAARVSRRSRRCSTDARIVSRAGERRHLKCLTGAGAALLPGAEQHSAERHSERLRLAGSGARDGDTLASVRSRLRQLRASRVGTCEPLRSTSARRIAMRDLCPALGSGPPR